VVTLLLWMGAACSGPGPAPAPVACDDTPVPSANPPSAMGPGPAVGSGDTWFFAPDTGGWGGSVEADPRGGYRTKIGLWTSMTRPPAVTVRRVGGAETGSASFAPTSAGLPGPLPAELRFPSAGCWQVTARGATGGATIQVRVG